MPVALPPLFPFANKMVISGEVEAKGDKEKVWKELIKRLKYKNKSFNIAFNNVPLFSNEL